MTEKVYIAIACHNRRRIAEQCLPTMRDSVAPWDVLALYNDGSTEYDASWLMQFLPAGGELFTAPSPLGIQAQRRNHLRHFLKSDCDRLYFSDHDMLMDPAWRSHGLKLQDDHNGAPVCLYDTAAHADMIGNTFATFTDVIWRRVAPGCSYLLTRRHVEKVASFIDNLEHFDWGLPALLGFRFAISRTSYCDHIGHGGERHPAGAGLDEGDRALNSTPWLVQKRREVVEALSV